MSGARRGANVGGPVSHDPVVYFEIFAPTHCPIQFIYVYLDVEC